MRTKLYLCILCLMLVCVPCMAENEDWETAFSVPSGEMDPPLAKQTALLCQACYTPVKMQKLLMDMGFDAESFVQKDYDSDEEHSAGVTFSRKRLTSADGTCKTLYAVIVRGTMSEQEMISNFHVGEGDISAGFDWAAQRVYGHWQDYFAQYPPYEGTEYILWITGHSRGAAVANLLAGVCFPNEVDPEHIYAYTFATPNVQKTTDEKAAVFNFILDGDVVTRVPPAEWGFGRHGTDIHCDQPMMGDIVLNSKENTDRLLRMIVGGGLSLNKYVTEVEPLLGTDSDQQKNALDYTSLLLLLLQGDGENVVQDPMNLMELTDYAQRVFPSHTMDTYLIWMDSLQ